MTDMTEHGEGLRAGTRIGEFEIVRELGAGGFGITYLAKDRSLGRRVALKEYFPGDWGSRRADGTVGPRASSSSSDYAWGLERFVEEARVLARLEHPNIVKVHRIVEGAGTAYIAMEYVEGRSLAEEIRLSGPLGEARVREVVAGLASGLAVVHGAGLLHRDIKPSNVMVRAVDGSPVLIDFGAAREQMGRTSRSINNVLTPGYAPVEQYGAAGGRQGPWTDIYALGALAYAALSGGRIPDDATERILGDRLQPVDAVVAGPLSGELSGAVMSALTTDYRRRPQAVGEWLAMLGEGGGVVAAGGPEDDGPDRASDVGGAASGRAVDAGSRGGDQASARRARTSGSRSKVAVAGGKRGRWRATPLAMAGGAVAIIGAALALWVELGDGDPAAVWMEAEQALGLSAEQRMLVQRGLRALGHDPGEGDGLLAGGTRAALRAWQTSRELEATGYLTVETAGALQRAGERAVADSVAQEQVLAEERAQAARRAEQQRLAAERTRPGRVFRDCDNCPQMVVVPAGSYMMGPPDGEEGARSDEGPRHRVTIRYPWAAGVHEVTFAEWDVCDAAGGCGGYRPDDRGWGRGSRPVINVSWEDAREYARWLSRETGEEYRLLSESEWEYVARAGTTTARHWGESESRQCGYANGLDATWRTGDSDRDGGVACTDGYEYTAPTGTFEANAFGLHDMLGNVWEWTEDCWNASYSGAPSDGSAWLSGDCSFRRLRGGSWLGSPGRLRSAARASLPVGHRNNYVGFRVARTIN